MKTLKEMRAILSEMEVRGWIRPDGKFHAHKHPDEVHAQSIRKLEPRAVRGKKHMDRNDVGVDHGYASVHIERHPKAKGLPHGGIVHYDSRKASPAVKARIDRLKKTKGSKDGHLEFADRAEYDK